MGWFEVISIDPVKGEDGGQKILTRVVEAADEWAAITAAGTKCYLVITVRAVENRPDGEEEGGKDE